MDLSTLTGEQLSIVKRLDGPLFVSAGAGSGKTYTLTQRIVWAFQPGSAGDGIALLDDLDQALVEFQLALEQCRGKRHLV